jgi:hypothetical protein
MSGKEIERELALLSLVLSIDQREKNTVFKRHIQKLKKLLVKIRELEKAQRKDLK